MLGFRHGFDWDHLAALTDLTGPQATPRRSMRLATLYVLGHALTILVLGALAIVFAAELPSAVDVVVERLVGISLVALGAWIAWTAVRTRQAPPLRSRWMLLLDAGRRAARRRRRGRAEQVVVIEHTHAHDHDRPMHEHAHAQGRVLDVHTGGGEDVGALEAAPVAVASGHSHLHRHVAVAPADPFTTTTGRAALGIGMLHGIGAETPTQVVVFAAAAHAGGRPTSLALLACFVVGLVGANTLVAAASTFGFRRTLARPVVATALAATTAAFSLVLGALLLTGHGGSLPTLS